MWEDPNSVAVKRRYLSPSPDRSEPQRSSQHADFELPVPGRSGSTYHVVYHATNHGTGPAKLADQARLGGLPRPPNNLPLARSVSGFDKSDVATNSGQTGAVNDPDLESRALVKRP
jgi:hypothetical protein